MSDNGCLSVTVEIELNGVRVPVTFDDHALATIAAAVTPKPQRESQSEFLTIPEAALLLGCGHKPCPNRIGSAGDAHGACRRCEGTGQIVNRGRVDDLLSARRIPRVKDGSRTLIRRSDLDAYLGGLRR